jgi:diguanylate cyclase (GGDEF)-like protein
MAVDSFAFGASLRDMTLPRPVRASGRKPRVVTAPVVLTWWLLGASLVLLVGRSVVEVLGGRSSFTDIAFTLVTALLIGSAVLNARAAGRDVERRNSESESFSRIMRALSRSVSQDAVVEAIVNELGAATDADHVAVVRLRRGSAVLDVTFVSMLPGTPISNTVMPVRQLEPLETKRLRHLPRQTPRQPLHLDIGPRSVWQEDGLDASNSPNPSAVSMPPAAADPDAGATAPAGDAQARTPDEATSILRRNMRNQATRSREAAADQDHAQEVADMIAYRLRDAYGLRNTLAAPLQDDQAIAGAIVLSRRTNDLWPEEAIRLLHMAANETSAALVRVHSFQTAESEARTDQLTQLPNRRYFDEYCKLLASRRRSSDRVAVLAVDVDHFKRLNDTYGHQVGDLVLQAIGGAIQSAVREEDVPARYGGEEFMVLLRNPSPGVALDIGERIRVGVRDLDMGSVGVVDRVTVSVGVASGLEAAEPIGHVVERADRALYAAKRTGRDKVVEAWHEDLD